MAFLLECLKSGAGSLVSSLAEPLCGTSALFLPKGPTPDHLKTERVARECFASLQAPQKDQVYGKVWELAKMEDARIGGPNWGEIHAFDSIERVATALHRLGFFEEEGAHLHPVRCLPFGFGEGGIGSQYFSLTEKLGRDSLTGQVAYVNGMGVPSLDHAGRDASIFSDRFLHGNNVHAVYHSTHQTSSQGDFLNANPGRNYLQIAHSEGAAHVNAALRLLKGARPDLLSRVRVLNFCPGHFVLPETYSPDLQVINFVKLEDKVINPWGAGTAAIGSSPHIVIVPHTHHEDHPHNQLSEDYRVASQPYIDHFMATGNLQ